MSLHQSISHLTKQEQNDLRHIVKTLSAALQPALLFCFGIRLLQKLYRNCFTQKRRNENHDAVYDLLIILHDKDALADDMAATVAGRMIGSNIKTNLLVHHLSFMKTQLLQMNFFFTWAHRSAILLINRDNSLAQLPPQKKKTDILPPSNESFSAIKEELDKAKALIAVITDQWALQPYAATLKTIQQSATGVIKAFIQLGLGYDACHLCIEAMIQLSENFSNILAQLFPNNTNEEKRIYSLLTHTTTGEIPQTDLLILFSRVKDLKQKVNDYQFKNSTLLKYEQENKVKKNLVVNGT